MIINLSEKGIYQTKLDGTPTPQLRIKLTNNFFKVLRCFYMNREPLTAMEIFGKLKANVSLRTIERAISLFKTNYLIKRILGESIGSKGHTYADRRYKYYLITPEGIQEFENYDKLKLFRK